MQKTFALAATLATAIPLAMPADVDAQVPGRHPPTLKTQTTEEGQMVIYDAYTWQRRELAKRLPLSERWPAESAITAQFRRYQPKGMRQVQLDLEDGTPVNASPFGDEYYRQLMFGRP